MFLPLIVVFRFDVILLSSSVVMMVLWEAWWVHSFLWGTVDSQRILRSEVVTGTRRFFWVSADFNLPAGMVVCCSQGASPTLYFLWRKVRNGLFSWCDGRILRSWNVQVRVISRICRNVFYGFHVGQTHDELCDFSSKLTKWILWDLSDWIGSDVFDSRTGSCLYSACFPAISNRRDRLKS